MFHVWNIPQEQGQTKEADRGTSSSTVLFCKDRFNFVDLFVVDRPFRNGMLPLHGVGCGGA
jgi:hypothetical protein